MVSNEPEQASSASTRPQASNTPDLIPALLLAITILLVPTLAHATTYEVGPDQDLQTISEVPWEALEAGDTVLIYWRPDPYHEKWVLAAHGTEDQPITVQGVPGPDGQLPLIDGRDATTRTQLNYWSEVRGIIKIGGANQPEIDTPSHIIIDGLEIAHARPPHQFTGRDGLSDYTKNAAAIFVESGDHITIRNCILRDAGNGLFVAHQTTNIVVEHNHLYDNGIVDSIYEHNSYTAADGILFQYNRYGLLCDGCLGNNLKDRSANTLIRHNWIEGGNRTLDLVDSNHLNERDGYHQTHVYGNILIEPQSPGNRQIIHYGGDSGDESNYRKGTLYFHHNTVISTRDERTTLMRLSTNEERAILTNNAVYIQSGGDNLSYVDSSGIMELHNNWFSQTPVDTFGTLTGEITVHPTNIFDTDPGFTDLSTQDFYLLENSPLRTAAALSDDAPTPEFQYSPHQGQQPRPDSPDIGALAFCDQDCQTPNPDPDPDPDLDPDPDSDPEPEPDADSDPEPDADSDPGTTPNTTENNSSGCTLTHPTKAPTTPLLLFTAAFLLLQRSARTLP